jgi:predicted alpha/beta hydrolase family esterase
MVADARIRRLLVPGRGVAYPDHWSRRWAREKPGFAWAPEPPGPPYEPAARVAALRRVLAADPAPAVLVAHSAGCLTVALWAASADVASTATATATADGNGDGAAGWAGQVRAALLVTPPFLSDELVAELGVPRRPLPFRAVVVASRDDPNATFEQAAAWARDWGAQVWDAGAVGHLDSKTGFGPWPAGERLVDALCAGATISRA